MTKQHLLDNGYRETVTPTMHLFQKCIQTAEGKKRYFINVNYFTYVHQVQNGIQVEIWTPSMQVTLRNGRSVSIEAVQWYNTFEHQSPPQFAQTITEVEEFFERMFMMLDAVDYDNE